MKSNAELYFEAIKLGKSDSLPSPNSRFEKYLYAIATGNKDDIPYPQSRNDEFLEYIALNGGVGNGSDNGNDYRHIHFKTKDELVEILKYLNSMNSIADVKNVTLTIK